MRVISARAPRWVKYDVAQACCDFGDPASEADEAEEAGLDSTLRGGSAWGWVRAE